jgi:CheY-like chemotaxis protein
MHGTKAHGMPVLRCDKHPISRGSTAASAGFPAAAALAPPPIRHASGRCTRGELLEARPLVMATNVLTTRDFSRSPVESPLRVLVVDDEPLIRWSVAETLGERGFEVVETGDALATRVAVRADPSFDVVLLDYRLPDSDDLSLLASIRHAVPSAQVIVMTAFGRPEVVQAALDLGAFQVISKPFAMETIAALVIEAARSRRRVH